MNRHTKTIAVMVIAILLSGCVKKTGEQYPAKNFKKVDGHPYVVQVYQDGQPTTKWVVKGDVLVENDATGIHFLDENTRKGVSITIRNGLEEN